VTSVAFKTPLKTRMGICIYETSSASTRWLYWIHTKPSPTISQQNCAHPIAIDLMSHYPIVCVVFSFALAKGRRKDASNPNASSETNPTRQSPYNTKSSAFGMQRHVVVICMYGMEWSKMSLWNCRLCGTITKHFGAKETLRLLNIISCDEVDPKFM